MVGTFSEEIQQSTLGLLQLTHTQKLEQWQPVLIIGSEAEFHVNRGMCASHNISTFQNMTSDSSFVYNK